MIQGTSWGLFSLPIFMVAVHRDPIRKTRIRNEQLDPIIQHIEKEVESGQLGAAVLLVAHKGKILVEQAFGRLSRDAGSPPCRSDSVFLVASISKPVTALAVMCLVEQGKIRLDDPAQKFLPEFKGEGRERITLRNLLSHSSGLPDMLPNNIELRRAQAALSQFAVETLRTPLLFEPGSQVSYQSMGVLLAAEIVERITGKSLDAFLQQEVFKPLKMHHSSMGLRNCLIADTVQCELPSSGELKMSAEDGAWNWNSAYWRNLGAPWGGMHTTVGDIFKLLQAMLDDGRGVLKPELAVEMVTDQNTKLSQPWGVGWKLGSEALFPGSSAKTFGHNGATGTLCWADPDRKLIFVLFTNRPLDNDREKFLETIAQEVSQNHPA